MKDPNASMLLLYFLPLKNKKVYLLDLKGCMIEEMALVLDLSPEGAKELCNSTRVLVKKLILILLQTKDNKLLRFSENVEKLKNLLMDECDRLGRCEMEELAGSQEKADRIVSICQTTLFKKLFPKE